MASANSFAIALKDTAAEDANSTLTSANPTRANTEAHAVTPSITTHARAPKVTVDETAR